MVEDLSAASGARLIPAAALVHVPGCEAGARPVAVSLLPGGTVNRSFRVATDAGQFVLRMNAIEGELLGANHEREAQLQQAAADAGVAPPLVYADSQGRFLIAKFIDGRVWQAADLESPAGVRRLGARLRVLHDIAAPAAAPFDLAARLRDYCTRLVAARPAESALFLRLLQRSEATLALCTDGARKASIVHNDLHHSNLIEADRLYLIDWEYAAVADPIFDLACVLAYYPQVQPYAWELLDSAGLAEEASIATLLAASALFVLLSFLWYRLRRLTCEAAPADLAAEEALLRRLCV
jgi:thiamine kinase